MRYYTRGVFFGPPGVTMDGIADHDSCNAMAMIVHNKPPDGTKPGCKHVQAVADQSQCICTMN
jgi:hypothetical protein